MAASNRTSASLAQARASFRKGRLDLAERGCRSILLQNPDDVDALHLLGLVHASRSDWKNSLPLLERALRLHPGNAVAWNDFGKVLLNLNQIDAALDSFGNATRLNADLAEAYVNRGNALLWPGRRLDSDTFEAALADFERALGLGAASPVPAYNRANVLAELGRFEEALAGYDAARTRFGASVDYHYNRAGTLQRMERFDEALQHYDAALKQRPELDVVRTSRAALLLRLGQFEEGWREHEWRRRGGSQAAKAPAGVTDWDGQISPGMPLLFQSEQGLGDTIQFARFAQQVARAGADVTLEVRPELVRLMRSLEGVKIVARGQAGKNFAGSTPLMSLPAKLGIGLPPQQPAYLSAEPEGAARLAQQLPAAPFRIGIAWQGNPLNSLDRGRSLPLTAFLPLADIPGVRLFSLQKNAGSEQLVDALGGIISPIDGLDAGPDAFVDTAAAMANLDLVITSDTAIAHLAGALGRPIWIVLQRLPDWRWMVDRTDSPWYPTARLFRQQRRNDWSDPFKQIEAALRGLLPPRLP